MAGSRGGIPLAHLVSEHESRTLLGEGGAGAAFWGGGPSRRLGEGSFQDPSSRNVRRAESWFREGWPRLAQSWAWSAVAESRSLI